MATNIQSVRGFRDLLPPESERTAAIEAAARKVLDLYGLRELRLPTLELHELFVKSTGETTDIVEKEMFQFEDAGGRRLALRPEGTPGTVRAFLNNALSQQGPACKLYYIGNMFRAERPQAGRYREFEQIGVEALGNPHPCADVELILALKAVFDSVGLAGKTRLRMNNLGCDEDPSCRPAFRAALKEFLLAREGELCESCRRRIHRNPLRALDCKADGPKLAAAAPKLKPCLKCSEHVDMVSRALNENGCPHVYPDPNLVRGLDYYNRTVFEFSADGVGAQDALAGGGRYDGLVASMGGAAVPAVGWALGVERTLMAALAADPTLAALKPYLPSERPAVFVALQSRGAQAEAAGIKLLAECRAKGLRAAGGLFGSSLKAQMREANRCGARWTAILGEEELKSGECTLKDLQGGAQERVSLFQAADKIASLPQDKAPNSPTESRP
ncbi:MAG: histidine--tRNA ligase [Elusimicrobiota bacterium]|jgi:histidyl-tRNA synthetase